MLAALLFAAHLQVVMTQRPPGKLTAELQLRGADDSLTAIRRTEVDASRSTLDFDGLAIGSYVLLLRGAAPLERFATKINLGDNDVRHVEVAIHPQPFEGLVTRGGKPLPDATIALQSSSFGWNAELRANKDGQVAGSIWQPGDFTATVDRIRVDDVTVHGAFTIDVSQRVVPGRVIDRDGLPVGGARITLKAREGDREWTSYKLTAADGSFSFEGAMAGESKVIVSADGYLNAEPVSFRMKPEEARHELSIVLESGVQRTLRIADADGNPSAGAAVLSANDGVVRADVVADNEGRALVSAVSPASVLYILARNGSLAVMRAGSDAVVRVTMPRASSSLRITTRTTDGAPLPEVGLLPAFDGQIMPPPVARMLARVHDTTLETNSAGEMTLRGIPAGSYQFWPYRSDEEAEAIVASSPMDAPINVNVKSGDNAIVVDFEPRP